MITFDDESGKTMMIPRALPALTMDQIRDWLTSEGWVCASNKYPHHLRYTRGVFSLTLPRDVIGKERENVEYRVLWMTRYSELHGSSVDELYHAIAGQKAGQKEAQ